MVNRSLPSIKAVSASAVLFGPESRMYEALKGKEVVICWKTDSVGFRVFLVWVDKYTIGVRKRSLKETSSIIMMVYKDAIKSIELWTEGSACKHNITQL